jgi:hypothetical protein
MLIKDLEKGIRQSIKDTINPKRPGGTQSKFTITCPHAIFKEAIWSVLPEGCHLRAPGKKKTTYLAQLSSLEQLASLLGRSAWVKFFPNGGVSLVCPQAVASCACSFYFMTSHGISVR